ncbi:MAG: glycosyltransferase [Acidobacteriota bacterium]|nr:glycosyltransferase [Acidobacteriota bacterium]
MRLSLIIPAYNEAGRIGATVTQVCAYLDAQPYDWEVLVVIDGDSGGAAAEARAAAGDRANMRVLTNQVNRGKGYSVRRGFAEATGDRLAFIDADLSLPVEGLGPMMARFDAGADVVIASRQAPGARVEGAPPALRAVMSRVFNVVVQAVALPGLSDTQCGFKGFTAAAARQIFASHRSDRFGFDVEALFLARKHGFRIVEMPVTCLYHAGSSVNRLGDVMSMLGDVLAVRWRHRN